MSPPDHEIVLDNADAAEAAFLGVDRDAPNYAICRIAVTVPHAKLRELLDEEITPEELTEWLAKDGWIERRLTSLFRAVPRSVADSVRRTTA